MELVKGEESQKIFDAPLPRLASVNFVFFLRASENEFLILTGLKKKKEKKRDPLWKLL